MTGTLPASPPLTSAPVRILPASGGSFAGVLESALERVEARFKEHLVHAAPQTAELCRYVERYRGKMLRPTLTLLCGLATSPSRDEVQVTDAHITTAAVLEMIHMATLVHDDVLDGADTRRGGATVNAAHGTHAAITLGDYLFARSFHLCSTLDTQRIALRIGEVTATVCEGEILQNATAGRFDLDERTYFDIIERKTAALIAASCELGAALSDADAVTVNQLSAFGLKIGTAFQIQDDLLDLVGDQYVVGKTLGRDLLAGKPTLPVIHHLGAFPVAERAARTTALMEAPPGDVQRALESTGSLQYARAVARKLVDDTRALLLELPASDARAALAAMAEAVVEREA